jgi:AraC-like DNA-binding protein
MSRMQLHRKLTALGGQSAALFIRSHRLRHARQLLETTALSVSEIAYASGFADPAYFTRCFKEEFGMTPSEWKRG